LSRPFWIHFLIEFISIFECMARPQCCIFIRTLFRNQIKNQEYLYEQLCWFLNRFNQHIMVFVRFINANNQITNTWNAHRVTLTESFGRENGRRRWTLFLMPMLGFEKGLNLMWCPIFCLR
jgi:hypothetical protein